MASNTPIFDALWKAKTAELGHAPGRAPRPTPAPVVNGRSMEELNEYYQGQAEMDDAATAPKPAKKTPRKRK